MISVNTEHPEIWDDYVGEHPESTLYHLYQWGGILRRTLGHRPYYLACRKDGRLRGVLPLVLMDNPLLGKKLHSMPVVDYGGILADSPLVMKELGRGAAKLAEKLGVRYLQLRNFYEQDLGGYLTSLEKVTFFLDLDRTEEELWKDFKGVIRNRVRKARKLDLESEFGKENLLRDFYQIFCQTMHYHGTPVYPRRLFLEILQVYPQYTDILLIRREDRPIAAAFIFSYRGHSECPWPASLTDIPFRPNDFMYWEMIKFCRQRGSRIFDFGRCSRKSGTYRFKKKWTKDMRELAFQYYLVKDRQMPAFGHSNSFHEMIISMWKKLPLPVANALGPILSPNIP